MDFDYTQERLTRSRAQDADDILGLPIKVLDKGFVTLVNYMGTDQDIARAARVSYGDGTRSVSDDEKLIEYLYSHGHTSPFEMVEVTFHIRLPIFVERQLSRHRTSSQNQESARYSIMSSDVYIPDVSRLARQSTDNKQGSGEGYSEETSKIIQDILQDTFTCARDSYEKLIQDHDLARETARQVITVSNYTELIWKQDLHNLFHLIALRWDDHAQYEIRAFSEAMAMIVQKIAPVAYKAFMTHRKNAKRFSQDEMEILSGVLDKNLLETQARAKGLTGRKLREFLKKIS